MKRPLIIRMQLLALGLVLLLVLYRAASGPGRPDGLIVFSDMKSDQLAHDAFVLDRPARLAVEAMGSFEREAAGEASVPLAAYGWILRRDDSRVVWQMRPDRVQLRRETLAHALDTLLLEPGTYDVYFATYGNTVGGHGQSLLERLAGRPSWQTDARKWMLALRSADGKLNHLARVRGEDEQEGMHDIIWRSEPVRDGGRAMHLFEVTRPTAVRIQAIGEIDEQPRDYAWIEDALSGERRWEMTRANTEPAGGAAWNRQFTGDVPLAPGLYRAVFEADNNHAYQGWRVNPPFNPRAWGVMLRAATPEGVRAIRPFDPWSSREPLVSILRVQNDVKRSVEFSVTAPLPVMVYALGEVVHGERFDHGWLEREDGEVLWEMPSDRTRHAGGGDKNQESGGFLTLEPGTYRLCYQTDDSHAYEAWNTDPPAHPERWGAALFPLSPSVPSEVVEILRESSSEPDAEDWDVPEAPEPPEPPEPVEGVLAVAEPGELVVKQVGVGNEANIEAGFELPERSRLHIQATGEITPRGRFDYGWIERVGSGEVVWEMKWDNTRPAGGDDRNRTFDGVIELPAGQYTAHFQSDLSHAYGDFGNQSPDDPRGWGLSVRRVE